MTFLGSGNRGLFKMWLAECLLPQLQLGDVIVIDNASFHRFQNIDEIVSAGCEIWYLPPYSPDLMPWRIGWGDDGMNLLAFAIALMPLLSNV